MTTKKRIAIYPGTFDPLTYGHIDIIKRSAKMCDTLILAIARDSKKESIFSLEERVAIAKEDIAKIVPKSLNVIVQPFDGLLVNYAKDNNASLIIRGLRAVTDFEYEVQMASVNAKLSKDLDTAFLMATEKHQFISASYVREIAKLGGNVKEFVTSATSKKLKQKFKDSAA